jgi:predicted O-linked N-acetylglucosamine transferase (SPINDLY family)
MLPIFAHHDHSRFEIVCFADVTGQDDVTQQLRARADAWHVTVGRSHAEVAELIRRERIDLLIDLAGHTAHTRLIVFAHRPAPVQATYLGYPDTTGLSAMDWRLTDAHADPPGDADALHTERLYRLPDTAWCFRPERDAPAVAPLPAESAGHVTFGSFNNFGKVNAAVLDAWAQVLAAVPRARLLIKAASLRDQPTRQRLVDALAVRGVEPGRVEAVESVKGEREHLALYGRVDIALDTFPYHGTTTTCEALWMGVPVVTLAGPTHASRVGVSLLSSVGLAEQIAPDVAGYVAIAAGLAGDLSSLAQLRRTLRERMLASPLMDAPRFTAHLESAYRAMGSAAPR